MNMHLYGLANAVSNAVSPTPPNQLNDWEKKALRSMRAQGYRIASPQYDHNLLELTGNVAKKFSLAEAPKIVVYRQEYPNAAMLSYSNTMFISTSIMEILNKDELEAVIGHELGHRKQQSKLLAAGFGGMALGLLGGSFITGKIRNGVEHLFNDKIPNAKFLHNSPNTQDFSKKTGHFLTRTPLLITLAFGFVSGLIATGVSYLMAPFKRHMEMDADKQSAEIVKKPEALISALQKLQNRARELHAKTIPATDPQLANVPIPPNPETPKTEAQKRDEKRLASHPDFATREKQLREIAAKQHGQLSHG